MLSYSLRKSIVKCKFKKIKSALDKHWFYYSKRQNDIVPKKEIVAMTTKIKTIINKKN